MWPNRKTDSVDRCSGEERLNGLKSMTQGRFGETREQNDGNF